MKNFTLIFLLFVSSVTGYAQVLFQGRDVSLSSSDKLILDKHLSSYQVRYLDTSELYEAVRGNHNDTKIKFEVSLDLSWDLTLVKNEIRASDYRAVSTNSSGEVFDSFDKECHTFGGYINNDPSQFVRLFIDQHVVKGIIFDKAKGYFLIEPLATFVSKNSDRQYVIYNVGAAKQQDGSCGVEAVYEEVLGKPLPNARIAANPYRVLEVATETDLEFYQFHGSNSNNANNAILNTLNVVDGIYQNVFNLKIIVTYQHVWTINDPYTFVDASLINQFRDDWNANRTNVRRSTAHLFTHKSLTTGTGDLWGMSSGNPGRVCNDPLASYAITRTESNSYIHQTTAHELGHQLGAYHPASGSNSCTPQESIMCQGGPRSNTDFSSYSQTQIINHMNTYPGCLNGISGPDHLCPSGTFTLTTTYSGPISWSSSGNISLSSSSSTSVNATYTGSGPGWIQASFPSNGVTVTARKNIYVGSPEVVQMQLNGSTIQTYSLNNVCVSSSHNMYATISGGGTSSWQFINNNTGASYSSTGTSNATVYSGYNTGGFVVKLVLSNGCGSVDRLYPFYANNCGYFSYTVYPNPATDLLTIEFETNTEARSFPEQIELLPESSYTTASVRSIDTRRESTKQQLKSSRKLDISVSDLPRGRYILRVTRENVSEADKAQDIIHVLLK